MNKLQKKPLSDGVVFSFLVTCLMSLLPFSFELSSWLTVFTLILLLWRSQVQNKENFKISRLLKSMIAVSSLTLWGVLQENIYSVEALTELLILTFCLKVLELEQRRDLFLLVFLGCFISACQLLFATSILSFSYALFCLVLYHVVLTLLFFSAKTDTALRQFKSASKKATIIFFQALPLAICLFIIMPRIDSLWQMPINSKVAKTGVSDQLSIGDIGRLNQDRSPAMRVTFKDLQQRPESSQLYWRGLVFEDFDGELWTRSKAVKPLFRNRLTALKQGRGQKESGGLLSTQYPVYNYQVMLEPTNQPWLYALAKPWVQQTGITAFEDETLRKSEVVRQRFQYDVTSFINRPRSLALPADVRRRNLALPKDINPRSRAYAEALARQFPVPEDFIAALMQRFKKEFSYTLSPGVIGAKHRIDAFFFEQKLGYCEHYSSSTVFLLRAAGFPARIVAGYQGGEWNAEQRYLLVTQADAHAWVEVWIDGRGWQRIDPTSFVAPDRIEQGANEFLSRLQIEPSFLRSVSSSPWIRSLRLYWDGTNYQWHKWVLGYNSEQQFSVLIAWLGGVDAWRMGMLIIFAGLVVAGLIFFVPFVRRFYQLLQFTHSYTPFKLVRVLEREMGKIGERRLKGETLTHFIKRVQLVYPEKKETLRQLDILLQELLYQPNTVAEFSSKQKLHFDQLLKDLKVT